MNPNLHRVIGIDLGTTYSAVSSYSSSSLQAETIINTAPGDGSTTASVIGIDPMTGKAIVGEAAKENRPLDPQNTIIEIKREMGEEFTADTLKKYNPTNIPHPEIQIGKPVVAHFAGEWLRPQEISAFTLMRMKQVAEEEIGEEIRDAVITVPAYFTEKQKRATSEAALMSGLYPRQLIPEPTAAAICYGVDRQDEGKHVYLVYDLGGGTFDVSIISAEGTNLSVIATAGDPRLGGGDFDDAIVNWAMVELATKFGLDLRTQVGDRALRDRALIKFYAEKAKIALSAMTETSMPLMQLNPSNPPVITLTRAKFEELIDTQLRKSITFVEKAIRSAEEEKGVQRDEITAILLVGGSSKIPKVRSLLLEYFQRGDDFIRGDADPDQVVARGAAILASRFAPSPAPFDIQRSPDSNMIVESDAVVDIGHITEHSLGVAVQGGIFNEIVRQGSTIPTEVTKGNYANAGPTTDIEVRVFQGEAPPKDGARYVHECTEIGIVHIGPIEPLPEGRHRFEVTFALDMNGLLTATVNQLNTGNKWTANFEHTTGVGGADALEGRRKRLLAMFGGKALQNIVHAEPIPVPVSGLPIPPQIPAPPPPMPAPPPPIPEPTPAAATPGAAISAITGTVPEQFKSVVRRTQKALDAAPNELLMKALVDFINAVNSSVTGDDLLELGDALEEAYLDARK